MTYEIAPAAAGRHALAQPSPTRHGGFPLSQRERAVFLDDCGPLPPGEVTDGEAEFQILALFLTSPSPNRPSTALPPSREEAHHMLTTPVLVSRFLPASVSPCLCGRSWALYTASHTVQFKNGKVCRKVTLFGYSRDFALLFTAQRVDKLRFKKMCHWSLSRNSPNSPVSC